MLIKNREERRNNTTLDAKIMLLKIISHTNGLTEKDWLDKNVKNAVKIDLGKFVDFVRYNKSFVSLETIMEFGRIQDFCNNKAELEIGSLNNCLMVISNNLLPHHNQ